MARRRLVALLVVGALGGPAPVRAQPAELQVAIHAPWSGPTTADERHALGQRIEAAIKGAGLGPARVSTFARLPDFRRALARADLAIVDAGVATALGGRLQVTASWSSGVPWVVAGIARPARLAGSRLALQAADDPGSERVVARLLRGQAGAGTWSRVVGAPITADARQLVVRGLADVVLVPGPLASGLTVVAELGSFGELAIAVAPGRPELARAAAAAQDALRAAMGGTWSAGPPALPGAVGPAALIAAPPAATLGSIIDLLGPLPNSVPALAVDDLWIEPDAR